MKFNKKLSVVDAIKLEYSSIAINELKKFIPSSIVACDKARHPTAIANFAISTYKGFSSHKTILFGKENEWLIKEANGTLRILSENDFLDQYESVVE